MDCDHRNLDSFSTVDRTWCGDSCFGVLERSDVDLEEELSGRIRYSRMEEGLMISELELEGAEIVRFENEVDRASGVKREGCDRGRTIHDLLRDFRNSVLNHGESRMNRVQDIFNLMLRIERLVKRDCKAYFKMVAAKDER